MIQRSDLQTWVFNALSEYGGRAHIVDVAKHIWKNHKSDLEMSGNKLYTWQYDMRWAAMVLRKKGKIKPVADSPRGVWELI